MSASIGLIPVHPGDLGVLRVHVVVAVLGAPELVAVRDHRHALRQQQRRQEVALLPRSQHQHRRVVGLALGAHVERAVVVAAVVAALAVRLVVLLVVRDQVAQREPVVRGDEVDRRDRAASGVLVQVARSGDPGCELAQGGRLAPPEVAHGIPVLAVPLRPLRREVADLVAAGPEVPRLGDQLHLRHDRVLLHELEERRQPVDLVELARQRRGQVEAETVDVHLGHPVAQRVHDQLQRVRVADVERVAGAGVVHVVLLVVLDEAVVRGVVDAAHRDRGPLVVAFRCVVVDDIQDHLDARGMQGQHHALELLRPAGRAGRWMRSRRAGRGTRSCCSPSSCAAPSPRAPSRAGTGAPASARSR